MCVLSTKEYVLAVEDALVSANAKRYEVEKKLKVMDKKLLVTLEELRSMRKLIKVKDKEYDFSKHFIEEMQEG